MKTRMFPASALALPLLIASALAAERADRLIADFEGETYGNWRVAGQAFGPGPAGGTLPGQMQVSGYQGERLVNSFYEGDGTTGTLTSPPFVVERDYLSFLIGGGGYAETTCMNLMLDGEVARTATGPNTVPGGSEELELHAWDVRDLQGKSVTIQIVDHATDGWGHINVDQILQTDQRPKMPVYRALEKGFTVQRRYLAIPIKNGAKKTELTLEIDGEVVRRYGTELAVDPADVDWYAFFNLESYRGKSAWVRAASATEDAFTSVRQEDRVPGSEQWYTEALRPQFHFSQTVGWNNDPNGMVYVDGEWHLFFQHNPVGWSWGNMTWGHAVSQDLVHWEQLPDALFPKTTAVGDCFSGGGTVDHKDTAGWKVSDNDVIVVFLTDTGAGESLAYSVDRGRTFTWYEGNPVVKHRGRDPKVIWYDYAPDDQPLNATARELGGHWVMAVYDEHEQYERNIAFYTSVDLKHWTEQSHLTGYYECPEFFELPVDGQTTKSRWVLLAADAQYAVGDFDGKTFTPEHEGKHRVHWGNYYASQTFDNSPDGRRIQMGWVRIPMPNMPFNQTFSFPHELTLRTTDEGARLFAQPVKEIEKLHGLRHAADAQDLSDGSPAKIAASGELLDIRATLELGGAQQVGLNIGGNRIVYDVVESELHGARLAPMNGRISLQVLVDRPMMEICGNDGRVFITTERKVKGDVDSIETFAEGGAARLIALEVYELKSIWHR